MHPFKKQLTLTLKTFEIVLSVKVLKTRSKNLVFFSVVVEKNYPVDSTLTTKVSGMLSKYNIIKQFLVKF